MSTPEDNNQTIMQITEELPSEWEQKRADDGKIYYQNTVTKTTQWEKPTSNNTDSSATATETETETKDTKINYVEEIKSNISLIIILVLTLISFGILVEALNANQLITVDPISPWVPGLDDWEDVSGACTLHYSSMPLYDSLSVNYNDVCDGSFSKDNLPDDTSEYETDYEEGYCVMHHAGNLLEAFMILSALSMWFAMILVVIYYIVSNEAIDFAFKQTHSTLLGKICSKWSYRIAIIVSITFNVLGIIIFILMANSVNSNYYGFECLCYYYSTFCYGSGCEWHACNAIDSPFNYGQTINIGWVPALILFLSLIFDVIYPHIYKTHKNQSNNTE